MVSNNNTEKEFLIKEGSSVNNYRWQLSVYDEATVAYITQKYNLPDIIAKLISTKKIPFDKIDNYLNPQLKTLLPSPFTMKDMDKATDRIIKAINNNETIGIFGDYDVDGATSSSILYRFLHDIGLKNIFIHIPDRQTEGYGLNSIGLDKLKNKGASLIVSVDCGITGFDAIDYANSIGLEVIVIDHHEAETRLPKGVAIVDAKRIDDNSKLTYLAACGVVFLLVVALNKTLRENNYYSTNNIIEPDLFSYLDLVAFGTICDVVPLVEANRAFVSIGIKVMAKRQNIGLKSLCDISNLNTSPTVYHLGYILGPRINAGGRVGNSSTGVELLTTRNPITANNLAITLNNYNTQRKDIEFRVLEEAFLKVEKDLQPDDSFIFVSGNNWHTGVIGIIAGRIKERYNIPVCVATIDENKIANGSARSIPEIDIGTAIIKAKELGILTEGGGHVMAAGFTLHQDNIPKFKEFLKEYISNSTNSQKITPVLKIDSIIDITGITHELTSKLSILEPFGTANEEPRFAILNAKLTGCDSLNGGHIRSFFTSDNGRSIVAMAYKALGSKLGDTLLNNKGKRFNIAGKIRTNIWQGKKHIQFVIDDIAGTS